MDRIEPGAGHDDGVNRVRRQSDKDLIGAARRGDVERGSAGQAAATEAATVDASAPLAAAAALMERHGGSHLVVVSQGQPVGVVSTLDLAGVIAWGGV